MIVVAFCVIILAVFAAMVANEYYQPYPVTLPQAAAVVISGCSSGIGLQTALHLADRKFRVYAGVRREEDIDVFESHEFITPIILDVTNTESIKAAVDFVANDLATQYGGAVKLSAVVNNAGIGYLSAVQEIDLVLFRTRLEINVIGALDLIQQFLPQLQENTAAGGAGRIVTVGSGRPTLLELQSPSSESVISLSLFDLKLSVRLLGDPADGRLRSLKARDGSAVRLAAHGAGHVQHLCQHGGTGHHRGYAHPQQAHSGRSAGGTAKCPYQYQCQLDFAGPRLAL